MYNGVEYAERGTLISSHQRAPGSHFISGTGENVHMALQIMYKKCRHRNMAFSLLCECTGNTLMLGAKFLPQHFI